MRRGGNKVGSRRTKRSVVGSCRAPKKVSNLAQLTGSGRSRVDDIDQVGSLVGNGARMQLA